jgi:membrane-bound ClpP family serine protease
MNKAVLYTTVAAGALVGAGYLARRAELRALTAPGIIPIITPFIDTTVAEDVLAVMERLPDDRITLVLHTLGGCVTACVLIANALRQFQESTAIVPYMAISGGTLIALNATRLEMGQRASLSAVDPVIMGQRVKHLAQDKDAPSVAALAGEYEVAMRNYLRDTLAVHVQPHRLHIAMDVFMGEHAPHAWPILRRSVRAVGIDVAPAAPKWAALVDAYRGRRF